MEQSHEEKGKRKRCPFRVQPGNVLPDAPGKSALSPLRNDHDHVTFQNGLCVQDWELYVNQDGRNPNFPNAQRKKRAKRKHATSSTGPMPAAPVSPGVYGHGPIPNCQGNTMFSALENQSITVEATKPIGDGMSAALPDSHKQLMLVLKNWIHETASQTRCLAKGAASEGETTQPQQLIEIISPAPACPPRPSPCLAGVLTRESQEKMMSCTEGEAGTAGTQAQVPLEMPHGLEKDSVHGFGKEESLEGGDTRSKLADDAQLQPRRSAFHLLRAGVTVM